jgi:tripartite-type tricarboxylate transporter receptor subunit TctC
MTRFHARTLFAALTVATASLAFAGAAAAQAYPSKPIRIIVPFPPGGITDIVTRVITDSLNKEWGQPVVTENRAGAAGNVGAAVAAQAPPDGYTMLMATIGVGSINEFLYKNMPYNTLRDLAPVAMVAQGPNGLVVPTESPIKNIQDLIARAKAAPGKLNYGTPGIGTSLHLASAMLAHRYGLDMQNVVYRGNTEVLAGLLKNEVTFMFDSITQVVAQHRKGAVRVLAVTNATRWPTLPDIPTMAEVGVPDFVVVPWFWLAAPSKTPRDIVEKWHEAVTRTIQTPEAKERYLNLGLEPRPMTIDGLVQHIQAERKRWSEVIQAAKITAN